VAGSARTVAVAIPRQDAVPDVPDSGNRTIGISVGLHLRATTPCAGRRARSAIVGDDRQVKRVWVAGVPGSGKSTVAAALARRLGVSHIELDALNHGPSWTQATPEELRARLDTAMAASPGGWVCDGGYESKLGETVASRAETVVWLDLPLPLVLGRVIRRTASRIARRTELWNGNRESLRMALSSDSIVVWAVRSHLKKRRTMPGVAARHPHVRLVRLRSRREVARFVNSVRPD
jgi:adenylate kinase family enzyme